MSRFCDTIEAILPILYVLLYTLLWLRVLIVKDLVLECCGGLSTSRILQETEFNDSLHNFSV